MQEKSSDQRLSHVEQKVDAIYVSVEKTRKYLFWTMVVTVVLFVLPLIGLLFAIPSFIGNYQNISSIANIGS